MAPAPIQLTVGAKKLFQADKLIPKQKAKNITGLKLGKLSLKARMNGSLSSALGSQGTR